MELHRYDIIEAELNYGRTGSIQKKKRPYIIVSNEKGTTNASIITVMPLTHIIKKCHLPVHGCLDAETETGLSKYSMIAWEYFREVFSRSRSCAKVRQSLVSKCFFAASRILT